MKKLRPNSFENFFAEPFHYDGGYGFAVHAKDQAEALDKMLEYFSDWHWMTGDILKYLKYDLKQNMSNCWVKWQGYTDDDGVFANGWVITSEYKGGQKGWRHVFSIDYDKHYITHGHHWEPQVDEDGYRSNSRSCNVCGDNF